ncbi:MAG: class I SAM-dependent methyltransferase [Bacteroidales bacterium]|nr:class I SAM-dependent methyltransferase [Bacteroidales bacterium]
MNKYIIYTILRQLRLIKFTDRLRFYISYIKSTRARRFFLKENPNVKLPPAYFMYETFNLNYQSFYNKSIETAKWLISYFEKHIEVQNCHILDWGCGPGRVIRHMPSLLSNTCTFYGTDYNKKYIDWCRRNINTVKFSSNDLYPPMQYPDSQFDIIYGISIFTHLSKPAHLSWFKELMRVLKPGGILLLTLHGDIFKNKLTSTEKAIYDEGKLVIKSYTKEGHRTFSAYQPKDFVIQLVANNKILEHIPGKVINNKPEQDVWLIQKIK